MPIVKMYLLEKGLPENDDPRRRAERRFINGIFLMLSGLMMTLTPQIASLMGIEAELIFEMLLVGLIVFCAGLAMLIGSGLLRHWASRQRDDYSLAETK